jgi:hypothetical protein
MVFFYNFVLLKKFAIITVLFIYLVSATELRELLKFPDMLEHYKEHKEKNKELSFFDFLGMHYSDVKHEDGDAEKDNKLPFKSHDNCQTINCNLLTVFDTQSYTIQPLAICINKIRFKQFQLIPSTFQVNIWQPPKFC